METTISHGVMHQTPSSAAPAAPTPTPVAAAPTTQASTTAAPGKEWMAGLTPELKGYLETKPNFSDPATLVESYRNLEKLRGVPEERLLKLPEKSDDPEWQKIYNRMGRPEKPDDYKLPIPEGEKENAEFTSWAKKAFHELGLTSKQAQSLAEKWNAQAEESQKAIALENQKQAQADLEGLKKDWGMAYDQNIGIAKEAAAAFGVKPEILDALEQQVGFSGVMKFMHAVGTKIQPDQFVSGAKGKNFGVLSPDGARAKIEMLKSDTDWLKRWSNGGVEEIEQLNKLVMQAHPDLQ